MYRPSKQAQKVERRDFLKGMAAAPALATLGTGAWARTAETDRSTPGSNDRIQVGVIGVGKRGQGLMISAGFAQPSQLEGRKQRLGTEGQTPLGIRIAAICDVYDSYAAWREAVTTHMAVLSYKWGCRVRWDSQQQKVLPAAAGSLKV